jgi:hypothetical protein
MELLEEHQIKNQTYITSGILWLLSSVLGVISLLAGRRAVLSTFMRFFQGSVSRSGADPGALLNILVSFPLVFLAIGIIIGGFEYHLRDKRLGTEASYWLFARTFSIEIGFLLLASFL